MRFRTRLLVIFLGVALVTNGISLAVMNVLADHYLHEAIRAKMLSITESVATMLDATLLEQVDGQDTPAWRSIRDTLRRVRNANRRVSGPLHELNDAVKRIGNADFDTPLQVRSKDEFGEVAEAVNQMAQGLKERDRVKTTFAHYVSHQVMDSILKSGADIRLSGDRRRISVLFCDIRGFTSISEKLKPEQVVLLLNDYFEAMVEVIFRHNGTLDKFIGDGIMVIFGAPEDDVYQEEHALKAAIEMQSELHKLALKWAEHGIDMRIGIGINSGPAVVGNIGSSRRMDYTAIGDTVNLASRLESATKELGVGILVSEYTYNAVRGAFQFQEMGAVHVKGRNDPVMTYTPVV